MKNIHDHLKKRKQEKQQLEEKVVEQRDKYIHAYLSDDELEILFRKGMNEKEIKDLLKRGFKKEELENIADYNNKVSDSSKRVGIFVDIITWIAALFS